MYKYWMTSVQLIETLEPSYVLMINGFCSLPTDKRLIVNSSVFISAKHLRPFKEVLWKEVLKL